MNAPSGFDNHYATLGLPQDASPDEVRRAFHTAAKRYHPDANPAADAAEVFLKIKEAFEVLADPAARAAYDHSIHPADFPELLEMEVLLSREDLVQTTDPQLLYMLLRLQTMTEEPPEQEPPNHVCLVIDASTSMQGIRMERVKGAVRKILTGLKPQDTISLVTFSDRAEVVLPPSRSIDIRRAEARLHLIQTGGGTEMASGLREGLRLVGRSLHSRSGTRRIILVTDGQTYGDEDACLEIAEQCRHEGITIGALGIGEDWNERFLEKLSARTGGASVYAAGPSDVARLLEHEFSSIQRVAADNLRFSLDSSGAAEIQALFRSEPDPAALEPGSRIPLGPIHHGETMICLVELRIQGTDQLSERSLGLEGEIVYDVPGRSIPTSRLRFSRRLKVRSMPAGDAASMSAPPALSAVLRRWTMYRLQERARLEVERGEFTAATRRLRSLATNLLAAGEKQLARNVFSEAARLEDGDAVTSKLDKSIMYGTKALGRFTPEGGKQDADLPEL